MGSLQDADSTTSARQFIYFHSRTSIFLSIAFPLVRVRRAVYNRGTTTDRRSKGGLVEKCVADVGVFLQVYLTPMNRATLLHAKLTISLCLPGTITKKRASVDSKLLPRLRNVGYWYTFER